MSLFFLENDWFEFFLSGLKWVWNLASWWGVRGLPGAILYIRWYKSIGALYWKEADCLHCSMGDNWGFNMSKRQVSAWGRENWQGENLNAPHFVPLCKQPWKPDMSLLHTLSIKYSPTLELIRWIGNLPPVWDPFMVYLFIIKLKNLSKDHIHCGQGYHGRGKALLKEASDLIKDKMARLQYASKISWDCPA